MQKELVQRINNLPPLPNSIFEIQKFQEVKNSTPEKLIKILKDDPLIVANILKGALFLVTFKFLRTFASPIRINKRSCVSKLTGCRNGNLAVKSSTKLLQLQLRPKRRKFRRRSSILKLIENINNKNK